MSQDDVDLLGKLYDLLTQIYARAHSDEAFLAFDPFGLPIPSDLFKLNPDDVAPSDSLAVERVSEIVNRVPSIGDGGGINWRLETVVGLVDQMLNASMPVSAEAASSLGHAKADASSKFDITLGSYSGVPGDRFRPVYATPSNWYDGSVEANWTPVSIGRGSNDPLPPPAPHRPAFASPAWRVLSGPNQQILAHPVTLQHPAFLAVAQQVQAAPAPGHLWAMLHANLLAAAQAHHFAAPLQAAQKPIVPVHLIDFMKQVAADSTSQPATSAGISVSFEYCIVALRRNWWPDELLMSRECYLPGYQKGDISDGGGREGKGLMPFAVTGFVAIRKLEISAQWSSEDLAAIDGSASLGPFSLLGRTFENGTLRCPGIQIGGYFCAAVPPWPYVSDPALAVPAASGAAPAAPVADAPAGQPAQSSIPTTPTQAPASPSPLSN